MAAVTFKIGDPIQGCAVVEVLAGGDIIAIITADPHGDGVRVISGRTIEAQKLPQPRELVEAIRISNDKPNVLAIALWRVE